MPKNALLIAAVAGLAWWGWSAWKKRQADLDQTAASHQLLQQQYKEGWGYGD